MTYPLISIRGGRRRHKASVTDGNTDILVTHGDTPTSIAVFPGAGATVTVQVTLSSWGEIDSGTANWFTWAAGGVTTNTLDQLTTPVNAIRMSTTGGDASWEVMV